MEQGRGVMELGQEGMVIAALVTGAPQSDRLMLDLIKTKPEELEYEAELITERKKKTKSAVT